MRKHLTVVPEESLTDAAQKKTGTIFRNNFQFSCKEHSFHG